MRLDKPSVCRLEATSDGSYENEPKLHLEKEELFKKYYSKKLIPSQSI
jgi:hypothetical protein